VQSAVTVESDGSINTTAPTAESDTTDHINDTVVQVIKDLPPKLRTVFVMAHVQNKPRKQIAKELAIPLKTLDKRMVRALRACRDKLDRRGVSLAP
jgi:RNA polymerase sigma factor (sigma-70 family)